MPGELVTRFIRHIEAKDLDSALSLLSADCEYDNVPMSKVHGPEQVSAVLGPFLGGFQEVDWVIHHQVESGTLDDGVVMNERTDRFRAGERWIELPVAGLFLVRDGKITLWRDYFDMASLSKLMAG
jgi:limonene-1,2-epoxide hydrolase